MPSLITAQEPRQSELGIQLSYLDHAVNPCDDFYHFACGTWLKNNPIPPDRSRWGTFDMLGKKNREVLRKILVDAELKKNAADPNSKKLADLYGSCMDKSTIEDKGAKPLRPELERISALNSKKQLAAEVSHLQKIGVSALFSFSSQQDYQDATRMIAAFDQGGFALPDRDYYLKKHFSKDREAYLKHIQKMLELSGESATKAAVDARNTLTIETALAKNSLDRVSQRDPLKVSHKIQIEEFEKLSPSFDWAQYLKNSKAPKFKMLNVADYGFFKDLGNVINQMPLQSWKSYLRWELVHSMAPELSSNFVNEDFAFYGTRLQGQKKLLPRWERCVRFADGGLGFALGKLYVQQYFPPQAKQDAADLLAEIEASMSSDISGLTWMGPETKMKALEKLKAMKNKIGYPKRWRDYSKLAIVQGDNLGNAERSSAFEFHRQLSKIGTPTDRDEWDMTPPTVNAYYDAQENDMNFPAGILQPPFYDPQADVASNLGAIGAVEGHELTHGFDDEGRLYDSQGNLRSWWTPKDAVAFKKRAECLVNQYSQYVVVKDVKDPKKDVKINGKLTLGENTADNGGARLAYAALQNKIASGAQSAGGFTPAQRFFIAWGQTWCQNQTQQSKRLQTLIDPHSSAKYRANGVVSNMPEFRQAFSCPEKSPMVSQNACQVW